MTRGTCSVGWFVAIALIGCKKPTPVCDVVYVNEWRFSVAGPVSGFLQVVNTGGAPLSVKTLEIVSLTDDHPVAEVRLTSTTIADEIPAGFAGGSLSLLSEALFRPLVPEPRATRGASYFSIEVADAPAGTYDIQAKARLRVAGASTELPITIHVVPGPEVSADPIAARRVSLYR